MANSGGGKIIFGRDETTTPGISDEETKPLDSARLLDKVEKFIRPAQIDISHETNDLENGNYLHTIIIKPAEYPIVMSRQGTWKGMDPKKEKGLFLKGDIWTRHGSKTERASYEDVRTWIEEKKEKALNNLLERIQLVTSLPEDSEIRGFTSSGKSIQTPSGFLENEVILREINKNHLIQPFYLLWLFTLRNGIRPTREELGLLIGSALRRQSTLYWWLIDAHDSPHLIVQELFSALDSQDRDKSDSARSIVEVASIYASDEQLEEIIQNLVQSRYAHFRDEGEKWEGRKFQLDKLNTRIEIPILEGRNLLDFSIPELHELGDKVTSALLKEKATANSRLLGNITRVMWWKLTQNPKI